MGENSRVVEIKVTAGAPFSSQGSSCIGGFEWVMSDNWGDQWPRFTEAEVGSLYTADENSWNTELFRDGIPGCETDVVHTNDHSSADDTGIASRNVCYSKMLFGFLRPSSRKSVVFHWWSSRDTFLGLLFRVKWIGSRYVMESHTGISHGNTNLKARSNAIHIGLLALISCLSIILAYSRGACIGTRCTGSTPKLKSTHPAHRAVCVAGPI